MMIFKPEDIQWSKKALKSKKTTDTEVIKMADTKLQIMETCESIAAILTDKNTKYGDSALNPVKVFSQNNTVNSLTVRMDDKISRIANTDGIDRDDLTDLVGYCVLYMIAMGWTGYDGEEKLETAGNCGNLGGCAGCNQCSPW